MIRKLLILRPEPGASASVARAAQLGIEAVAAPIFTVEARTWQAPDARRYDAILFTSANAARLGGDQLGAYVHLPCYAVGEASAAAASAAGFNVTCTGPADGDAVTALMAEHGVSRALHPCGRDHVALTGPVRIDHIPVYAAEPVAALPPAALDAIRGGAAVALHSPRAARIFADLADPAGLDRAATSLVSISPAAAAAAGDGWKAKLVAPAPRDEALLVLAAKLCNNDSAATSVGG